MNARPVRTLFWAQWRKNRPMILTTLATIAGAYAILWVVDSGGVRENAGNSSEDFLVAILLISIPSLVAAASILLSHSDSERLSISLPARILRLPLTTSKLVAVLLFFGVLVAAGISAAATLPAVFMLDVDFAWWIPVLTASLAMAFIQLWAYTFGNATARIALISFLICICSFAWIAQRPLLVELGTKSGPVMALLILTVILAAIYALALWVTTILRTGGWSGRFAILNPGRAPASRRRRPFSSKRAAQFWYEWKLFGTLLPSYVAGVAVAYFVGLPLVIGIFRISDSTGNSSSEGVEALFSISWFTSAQFLSTGIVLSSVLGAVMVSGVMFMRAGHWNSQSNYLLTRPLSIHRIATARLTMMLASACAAFLLMLGSLGLLSLYLEGTGEVLGFIPFLRQGYEHLPVFYSLAFFWGGAFLMLWTCSWSVNSAWLLSVAAIIYAPPIAALWALALIGGISVNDAQTMTYATVYICNWIASAALVLGLLWMAYQNKKRRLVHPSYIWIAAALWIAYTSAFYLFVTQWSVPPGAHDWIVRFPNPVNWSIWIGISALPVTPLFLQPLLLENARHR